MDYPFWIKFMCSFFMWVGCWVTCVSFWLSGSSILSYHVGQRKIWCGLRKFGVGGVQCRNQWNFIVIR